MMTHPDIQKKAQNELDTVIGERRLPTLNDRPTLPYVEAIVKEVLRWQPVTPLGM
jgi:cytochrome P450